MNVVNLRDATTVIPRRMVIAAPAFTREGGAEVFAANMAEAWQRRGWDVQLLATQGPGDRWKELSGQFRCHDLSPLPLSLGKVRECAKILGETAPEVLLLNHAPLVHYALPLLDRTVKPVAILHANERAHYQVASIMRRRVWRWVAPSPAVADEARRVLGPRLQSRVRFVPHGVPEDVFVGRSERNGLAERTLVFAGAVMAHKGADLLPGILRGVRAAVPDVRLSIAGCGDLERSIAEELARYGLTDAVSWLGQLPPNRMPEAFRGAALLLLPTVGESFGQVIAEAMLCGTVPVVTRLQGVTDSIVDDGINGRLVEPRSIAAFTSAVVELLSSPAARQRMGEEAIIRARQRFTRDRMISDYERLFGEEDDRLGRTASTAGWLAEITGDILGNPGFRGARMRRWLQMLRCLTGMRDRRDAGAEPGRG
ncbi:MAG: hypothetical protein A3K19_16405 [Lentisphaerae bacterium RIFOXYB12_FULL_65_16]|nr:MAG: hypothetical protein A3K18_32835 [Lentisphaerae bacterium RIFOXYA12_64_32]OGV89025.1 MAG: hypothetical protein A3K19_16405 [Lentisphaerae bacterium RIFOXYB12_FULL_65_16]